MRRAKKRKKLIIQFFAIVAGIVGGFILVVTAASGITNMFAQAGQKKTQVNTDSNLDKPNDGDDSQNNDQNNMQNVLEPPQKTYVLIAGKDDEAQLTDTLVTVCFDAKTKKINLISIPRDTYITMGNERYKEVSKRNSNAPRNMKINSVYGYAGKEHNLEYLKAEIEDILGIKFDYHILMDLKAFRSIVDAIDGVEMTIRAKGMNYWDPTQNLRINVPGGKQILDGKKAEGAVRFRDDYPGGDLERIEFQQEFMKAMFTQVLSKDSLMKDVASLIATIIGYVDTNIQFEDTLMYVKYISDIKPENIAFYRLPGEPTTIYPNGVKTSIFQYDKKETQTLVDEVFISTAEPEPPASSSKPTATPKKIDLKSLKIQVLNGGNVAGLAGRKSEELKDEGLNVTDVGNYSGTQKKETRIMVRDEEVLAQHEKSFDKFFKKVVMESDSTIPSKYDAIIIIGTDEK